MPLLLLLLSWIGPGCARHPLAAETTPDAALESVVGTQAECLPRFPDRDGWYGGDAAYSVPLPMDESRTSLWLFGDSFVKQPGAGDIRAYPFVHNSVGLSRCDPDDGWHLETFWKHDDAGRPRAFFEPDAEADWVREASETSTVRPYYWPFDGFIAHDALFIALVRVVHASPRGAFNLPFRLVGVDLARIANYRDAPRDWRIRISSLSNDREAFPGSAFVVMPPYLYAFAFVDGGGIGTPQILSRLPLRSLAEWRPDLSTALETLGAGGGWKAGFEPRDAAILMPDAASEISVHRDPHSGHWVAVYSELTPRGAAGAPLRIRARTAPALVGPWSPAETLGEIPETRAGHPRSRDGNLFCYAGKAHPQFSTDRELLVTYVCNLYAKDPERAFAVLERLRESSDLYRPRAIRTPPASRGPRRRSGDR